MKQKQKVRFMLGVLIFLVLVAGMKMTARAEKSGGYEYHKMQDGNVYIDEYTGNAKNVTIPKKIKGKKVKGVNYLEYFSDSVMNVVIPEGVTFIGSYDWEDARGCNYVKTITLPKSMKRIDENYFDFCRNLSYIKYNGTKKQWKAIEPKGLKSISIEVRCKDGVINKNKKNKNYKYAVQKDNTIAIRRYIGKSKSVTIPLKIEGKKVTAIDYQAFKDCKSVQSVVIPKGVKSIRSETFINCKNLTKITIPNGVKSIGDYAFSGCENLTKIIIPSSVKKIEYGAFPGTISYIKYSGTKKQWKALKTYLEYDSAVEIHYKGGIINEHKKTKDYQYVILENNKIEISKYLGNDKNAKIPSKIGGKTVVSIGFMAFKNCSKLEVLTIPTSIKEIEPDAVYNCKKLFTISYSGTSDQWSKIKIHTYSNNGEGDEWLRPVQIWYEEDEKTANPVERSKDYVYNSSGEILKYIGKDTKVQVPKTITKPAYWVFESEKVNINTIQDYAFKNCTKVKSIVIPKTVTSIGSNVFENCTSLEKITIPTSVKEIGVNLFGNCGKLPYVTYTGTTKQWKKLAGIFSEKDVVCKNGVVAGDINYAFFKSVKAGKKSFTATWSKVDGALGYQIRYTTDQYFKKNIKTVSVKNSKATSTTIKKLKSGQNYYVQIRAYRKVHKTKKTIYSYNWSGYDNGTYICVTVK